MEAPPKPYTWLVYDDRGDVPNTTSQKYSSYYCYPGIIFVYIGVDSSENLGDVEVRMKEEYCKCRFAKKIDEARLELQMHENHRETNS